jgi:AraC-like DNA-binding protein
MSKSRQSAVVVRTSTVGFSSGYRWRGRASGWGQLLWATRGVITVSVGDALWVVPPRQALWLPPATSHEVEMAGRGVLRSVYITPARCLRLASTARVMALPPLLRELLRRVLEQDTLSINAPRDARLLGVLLDELTHEPLAPIELPMPIDARARRAAELLRAVVDEEPDVQAIASRAGASVRTLERYFHAETGLSFGVWRQRARLVRAMTQLANGATVTAAGLAAGYASTSAFVAAFRRTVGITPGRYVKGAW